MTTDRDPLDDIKALMDQATPQPDAVKKVDTLARAEEIFARAQGSADAPRPTSDRPIWGGFVRGAVRMFATLTSRPGLTATTALVAVGIIAFLPIWDEAQLSSGKLRETITEEEVPAFVEPEAILEEPVVVEMAATSETPAAPRLRSSTPSGGVTLTGPAELGLTGDRASTEFRQDLDVEFSMSGETDNRLRFGTPLDLDEAAKTPLETNTEVFANEEPSSVKITTVEPVSTFSIDVDTASYSVVRSSLMNGYLPSPDAVRIEEMVNYFPYDYAAPTPGEGPFKPTVSIAPTPWNPDTQLMHIAIQGEMPAIKDRPPLNLVFLIDTSGSMRDANKLPLLKQSFRLMLGQLRPEDEVSIVTYAGSAGQVLAPTKAAERSTILAALDRLDAGGSTAGQAGLQQAYATADTMTANGEITRVILATDGDFNVGIHDPEALKDYIAEKRDTGTYLSVLGFGRGNLDDATMQALAQNGNGLAAYIDTLSEAQKVLVDQLTGALFPIANDVKIQVEFNPAAIAEYRLIGYETRALAREDFNNDRVDAGEIGAGHSVTAIYELTPVGSPAVLNDPLRYADAGDGPQGTDEELAFLRLRYKSPGEDTSKLIQIPVTNDMVSVSSESGFAASIAGFGQLLKGGKYTGAWSYADAIALAEANTGDDPFGYRREAIQLMRLAQSLSQ